MPKVPEEQSQFNTTNIPGVAFPFRQQMGKVGESIQGIGGGVERAAETYNGVYDEIQRQHDISTSSTAVAVSEASHQNMIDQLKQASPDGLMYDSNGSAIKNEDGTQRTITQEYWDKANNDYTKNQDNMSPRAAAMYREKMLPAMAGNAIRVQHLSLELQTQAAHQSIDNIAEIKKKGWNDSPFPQDSPYINRQETDSAGNTFINMRPDIGKFSRDMAGIQLTIQQHGSVSGVEGEEAPGLFNSTQVKAEQQKKAQDGADSWMHSALTDWQENDRPRDKKQPVSTTALHQLTNLRDVVMGIDPSSKDQASKNMPTIASSLSAEQQEKWRDHLDSLMRQAVKIDRSEFENALENVKAGALSGQYKTENLEQYSDIKHLIAAYEPLGFSDYDKMNKVFIPIVTNITKSQAGSAALDNSSMADQRKAYGNIINKNMLLLQQKAGMFGIKYTQDQGNQVYQGVHSEFESLMQKQQNEKDTDLAKFESQPASGVQDPRSPSYRSATMYRFSKLDQSDIPGMVASGQLPGVLKTMEKFTHVNYGINATPTYMPVDTYKSMAQSLMNAPTGDMVNKQLTSLAEAPGVGPDKAHLMLHQMVELGKLDPAYEMAFRQNSPTDRILALDAIKSKNGNVALMEKSGGSIKTMNEAATAALKDQEQFTNMQHGNTAEAQEEILARRAIFNSAYSDAINNNLSESEAAIAANEAVNKQTDQISIVGAHKEWPVVGKYFASGPQIPVKLPRDLSPTEQDTVKQNLLVGIHKLTGLEIVPPKDMDPAVAAHMDADWLRKNGAGWVPVQTDKGRAYQYMYHLTNPDGSWNGKTTALQVKGWGDEKERNFQLLESDLRKPTGTPAPKALPKFQSNVVPQGKSEYESVGGP